MVNLRMELNAPCLLPYDAESCHTDILRTGNQPIIVWDTSYRIAVRHPHLRSLRQPLYQRIGGIAHRQHGTPIFATRSRRNLAAIRRSKQLCPIADAQKRQPAFDGRQIGIRRPCIAHGTRASRENHTPYRIVQRWNLVERMNFTIYVQFTHATRNELRILGTEIEYQYFLHRIGLFNLVRQVDCTNRPFSSVHRAIPFSFR